MDQDVTLAEFFRRRKVEPDQLLLQAIKMSGLTGEKDWFNDGRVFHALYRLNSVVSRHLKLDVPGVGRHRLSGIETTPSSLVVMEIGEAVLKSALRLRKLRHTITATDFLRGVIQEALRTDDQYKLRPFTVDLLAAVYGRHSEARLIDMPEVARLLKVLDSNLVSEEDFQYLIGLSQGRLCFRVVSVLDDYLQRNDSGRLLPQRAVLTHFKDQFGGFTQDEIEELEALLNSTARETDFQQFFDIHPHFLRTWDHREVYSHVTLARPEGALIPDFLLTDVALQRAAVLELKLPTPSLVRRQKNRDRFATAVMEARAQLLRYKDWFRDAHNRQLLKEVVRMEIYEPTLIAVVGRSSAFRDGIDRQQLRADVKDIEVVTYDDILTYAKRRRLIIEG